MEIWLVWKTKLFIVFICVVLWGLSLSWSSIFVCNELSLSTTKNVFMDCREAKQMEIVEGTTTAAVIPLISPRHPSKRSNWSFGNSFHAQPFFVRFGDLELQLTCLLDLHLFHLWKTTVCLHLGSQTRCSIYKLCSVLHVLGLKVCILRRIRHDNGILEQKPFKKTHTAHILYFL